MDGAVNFARGGGIRGARARGGVEPGARRILGERRTKLEPCAVRRFRPSSVSTPNWSAFPSVVSAFRSRRAGAVARRGDVGGSEGRRCAARRQRCDASARLQRRLQLLHCTYLRPRALLRPRRAKNPSQSSLERCMSSFEMESCEHRCEPLLKVVIGRSRWRCRLCRGTTSCWRTVRRPH